MEHLEVNAFSDRQPLIRILIADDHPVIRSGIRSIIAGEAGMQVIGEAVDGDAAIAAALHLEPDVLLLDRLMPGLPGLDTLREMMARCPRVKIILLTGTISPKQIIEALEVGARGIVLKDAVSTELGVAVRTIVDGSYWIGGSRVVNLVSALRTRIDKEALEHTRKTCGLTPREFDIIEQILEGAPNKDIALTLAIEENTVKRHLSHIYDKTGVSTRLELALFAIDRELIVAKLDSANPDG